VSLRSGSVDVELPTTGQQQEFPVGQGEDRVRNATCGPELVEVSQRAIDDGGNGLWMTNGRYPADRLAGVFAYEVS
jgi:hypothetical protein